MKCDCQMGRKHIQAQDINSNQTFHVETCCLLSRKKPDGYVHLTLDMKDYYRVKEDGGKDNE